MDEDSGLPRKRRAKRVEQTPLQRALGLLVRREHSRRELTRKLLARGIEAEQAQAAVDRLSEDGWQDEARFAHGLVRSRAAAGYGPMHIRAELGTHGLPADLVAEAMDAFEGSWEANARDLVRRRVGSDLGELALRRKAADLLARRGFAGDMIGRVTRGGAQDWDEPA
jgi:regulatory protein